MLQTFQKNLNIQFAFLKDKKVLVACSGGVDSIVLSLLLKKSGISIGLAHCNFSLRGKESDADESFVIDWADRLSIPVFTETFDTKTFAKDNKLSTQMAARQLRYQWFSEVMKDFDYQYIATGHHADDDLETFFINLSRGTGLQGLTGIPEIHNAIVRPLLSFSREEIVQFATYNNLSWREDSSNAKTDYLRNKLRHDVIPEFKNATEGVLQNFKKTQQFLNDSQHLIEDYIALVYNLAVTENFDGYTLHLQKLKELPHTEALLYQLLHPFGFTDWEAVSELLEAQSGKQIFSETHRLLKDRNVFLLTKIPSEEKKEQFFIQKNTKKIDHPIKLELNPIDKIGYIDSSVIYVDFDTLQFPLKLRKWQKGDTFQPFGMKGKKKISKFFKDEKLSLIAKEQVWLLCSDSKIIWIVGHRVDDRFKVTPSTKNILKISVKD
ncbi:tRNA lysidine(34) synthetase TilS [Marixanthomonas sp. SCSIO 43207]|uniref:tRNA lysidine(34) synthetase TilS n=1 Tax=Marixanthomonas sp. SCSIO 43207 TaxID=2779360 RepID=UPI001CA7DC47|nr:tRNA lysidine(34) synthetase TilS [Marixanthomonas sp. SCSIO 43207]UAB80464.1 tRNA lysidine(34) synthetase TilS [Marixanthomonas sp. SCSIO 43207]